jgi:DNA-binding NtrC family response regulator
MASSGKRILIADDEAEIREILKDLLEDLGEVVCVENGALALKQLEQSHFDLVITDYNMPQLNGMELLRTVNEMGIKTSIIWITGRSTKDLVLDAWREGVFDYIEKPFEMDQVRKSVITCLSMAVDQIPQGENFFTKNHFMELKLEIRNEVFEKAKDHARKQGVSLGSYVVGLIKKDLKM